MEVISSIIYHYLSIISNLGFHHSLKYYHFQLYVYMWVYTSTYLNYKFLGFSQAKCNYSVTVLMHSNRVIIFALHCRNMNSARSACKGMNQENDENYLEWWRSDS
jgi:hypothetical protein